MNCRIFRSKNLTIIQFRYKNDFGTVMKTTMLRRYPSIYYLTLFFEFFHFAGDYTRTKDSFGSPSCCGIHVTPDSREERLQQCIGAFVRPMCPMARSKFVIKLSRISGSDFRVATVLSQALLMYGVLRIYFWCWIYRAALTPFVCFAMLSAAMKLLDVRSLNVQTFRSLSLP